MSEHSELDEVVALLKDGKTVPPVSIRTFLSWFDARRRTPGNVQYIDNQLSMANVRTVPGYLNAWVDAPITFELATSESAAGASPGTGHSEEELQHSDEGDPSFKIGKIIRPEKLLVSVKPNALLYEAITIMLTRNFSQIPVMTSERDVKGVVSWASIGGRMAVGITGSDVQAYMDEARELPASATVFDAIREIREAGYVLVKAADRKVIGIVTGSDIAEQFESVSTPFLLLNEIESHLRALIAKKLVKSDIKRSCSPEHLPKNFAATSDLTFGNLVRILEYAENWNKLGLQLDRVVFCQQLTEINEIRNDVMHFDPDPLANESLTTLRNLARLLDSLRSIGAF